MTIKTPVKALRSWEDALTIEDFDEDERADRLARPFTKIVDADGETVTTAHDLFEFKPGHAERIVACLDACAGIDTEALAAQAKCGGMRAVVDAGHRASDRVADLALRCHDLTLALREARQGLDDVQQHLRITLRGEVRMSTVYVICERALARSKE